MRIEVTIRGFMKKHWAALGLVLLTGTAVAQTTFMCGSSSCNGYATGITGIDNLKVGGDSFDVTFSNTQSSTFSFSSYASTTGQPLTGVDAANAINSFYGAQVTESGPYISGLINGQSVLISDIVTAYQTSNNGLTAIDVANPFLGYAPTPVSVAVNGGDSASGGPVVTASVASPCGIATCTTWKEISGPVVSAPELEPRSMIGVMTLLFGLLAVAQRGSRKKPMVSRAS